MRTIARASALATVVCIAFSLAGCATVDPAQSFSLVQDTLAARVDGEVKWKAGVPDIPGAREAIDRLLAHPLSADDAVRIALVNNRRLQADFERLGIAQADLVEAGLLDNPVLSLSLFYGDPGTIVEAGIVQDVIGLLSLSVRRKIAGAQADRVIAQVGQRVLDLAAQVKAHYYTVVGDAQALELAQQVADSTGAAAELARRQLEAGNLSRREQAMQQAFHAQTALELAQAQARLAMDREKLNELMGLWGADTQWRTPQRLPELPRTLPELARVEETAVSQRLDLEAARKEAEAAAQALHLTRQFRFLSPLGLGVAYKREADGEKFFGPEIELGVPIFNQGQGRIARAQAESASAAASVAALAVEIRAQARTARAQVMAANDSVRHYERALLPLQQSIVEETLKFYNGMLVGPYDLLLAQQSQVQTAGRYVEAKKAFWHAWVDLERALGGRVEITTSAPEASKPVPAEASAPPPHAHE